MRAPTDSDPRETRLPDDVTPVVPLPRAPISGIAIAVLCGVLAAVLFFVLDGSRRQRERASTQSITLDGEIFPPPPLQVPVGPPPVPPAEPLPPKVVARTAPNFPLPPGNYPFGNPLTPPSNFLRSPSPPQTTATNPSAPVALASAATGPEGDPVLILDTGTGSASGKTNAKTGDGEEAVASDDSAVHATRIHNRATLVPQGTIVNAVLETPIDSTRPGLVRAVISRDVRGFDGSRILIPRGSRLIGEAQGDIKPGQKRVLVEWSRLLRPDGIAIRIASPASDNLGGAGINGRVNSHFFQRFTNAALQSALSAGVAIASRSGSGPYIYTGPLQSAGQSLFPDVAPGATIKVSAGAEIDVFVSHDLDFSGTR